MMLRLFTYRELAPDVQANVVKLLQEGAGSDPALADHLREKVAAELQELHYPAGDIERSPDDKQILFFGELDLPALADRLLDPDEYNKVAPHLDQLSARIIRERVLGATQDWRFVRPSAPENALISYVESVTVFADRLWDDAQKTATYLAEMADEELKYMTDEPRLVEFLESDDLARYLEDGSIAVEAEEEHFA